MEYVNLLIAIRQSGRRQYEIARDAGLREGRLSEIVRRGGASEAEQLRLSATLRPLWTLPRPSEELAFRS